MTCLAGAPHHAPMATDPPEKKEQSAVEKIDIKKLMTPEEFNAFGLNKLSPVELQKLNAFLNMNRGKLAPGDQPQ